MTSGSTTSKGQRVPAGVNRRDVAVAVAVVLLGVVVIGLALGVEPGVQTDPLGPRAFPLTLGGAIVFCGLLLGVAAVTGDGWTASTAMFVESADDDASEVAAHSPRRLAMAVAATAAYLFLFERLGYLLATPLYIAFIMLLHPGVRPRAFVTAPVLVTLGLYAAFRFGLLIPIPDGILESWLPW